MLFVFYRTLYLDARYLRSDMLSFLAYIILIHHYLSHGKLLPICFCMAVGCTYIFNMFALFSFGPILEYTLGSKRFFNFYFICGIGAIVLANDWYRLYEVHALIGGTFTIAYT